MDTGPDTHNGHAMHRSPAGGRPTCRWVLNESGMPEMVWVCLTEERDSSNKWESVGPDVRNRVESGKRSADIVAIKAAA